MVDALQSTNLTKIGIGMIVGLVVIGLLLSLIITAIVGRIVVLVVVVALGVLVWQQRTSIENKVDDAVKKHKCDLSVSFFGFKIDAPDDLKAYCRKHA